MGVRILLLLTLLSFAAAQGPEKRRTGNICHVDMDCPDNAFCRQASYCVCKDGFVYSSVNSTHKGCLKEAKFGEECIQHIQCHSTMGVQSECDNGNCRCTAKAHLEDNRCYETALVGERCNVDQNCYLGETGPMRQAFCVRGYCTCPLQSSPRDNDCLQKSYKTPVVGERCNVDQNCYLGETGPMRQAFCVRGYCTCPLQSSPRDNGTRCVQDAVLGEKCEDQLQCAGPGLQCQGTCQCRQNWVPHTETNTCVETVIELGEPCEYDVQCEGLVGTSDAKSLGSALCLGGICQCSYSARAAGNPPRCWYRRRPGQECKRDEECVSEEDEPGYCLNGRCTCKTCSPDASDFGGACTIPRSPFFIATAAAAAAILRH